MPKGKLGTEGSSACEMCRRPASNRCSSCLVAHYCSKEHQKKHWSSHKSQCVPVKIQEDEALGRCLVATRNVRKGEIVVREAPLVKGPPNHSGPVCLGCYNLLEPDSAVPCAKCGWPMCSVSCSDHPDHIPECSWAVAKRKDKVKISQFTTPHPSYAIIMPLRGLFLKDNHPTKWNQLTSLQSHCEERKQSGDYEQDRFSVASFIRRFYKLSEFSEEEILTICGILQINGHEVPLSDPEHVAVFWKSSMLEHSCLPNCAKTFTESGDILIQAAVDIPKGSHLHICYSDSAWSTPARRQHLSLTKFFSCACSRCSDPTENGTFFSAVRCCKKDCDGLALPKCFINDFKTWRCLKCAHEMPGEQISTIYAKVAEEASGLDKYHSSVSTYLSAIDKINDYVGENFCQLTEIKLTLAQMIGRTSERGMENLNDALLTTKEALCRQLILLSDSIFPAEHRMRGALYFELHETLSEQARRHLAEEDDANGFIELSECGDCLEKVLYFLKYEPSVLTEGQMYIKALQFREPLELLLKSVCKRRKINI